MADSTGVRDARRPPFCYQTHVALDAVRAHFEGSRVSTALAVYLSLTEAANRNGGSEARGGFTATRSELATRAGVSRDTFDRYVPGLIKCGVLELERRQEGGAPLPNRWILLDPQGAPPSRARAATPGARAARVAAPVRPLARASEVEHLKLEEGPPIDAPRVQDAWLACAPPLIDHRPEFFQAAKVQTAIKRVLKIYPVEDVATAIRNYADVIASPAHYWSKSWTLLEFLDRGIDRFVAEADPLENFRSSRGPAPGRGDADAILLEAKQARDREQARGGMRRELGRE